MRGLLCVQICATWLELCDAPMDYLYLILIYDSWTKPSERYGLPGLDYLRMVPSGQPNPMGPGQQLGAPSCCGRAPASSALAPAGAAVASRAWRWLAAIPMFLQLERAWGCSRGGVVVAHDAAALPRP